MASVALAVVLGVAAGRVLQDSSLPVSWIIFLAVLYGVGIGFVEHLVAEGKREEEAANLKT